MRKGGGTAMFGPRIDRPSPPHQQQHDTIQTKGPIWRRRVAKIEPPAPQPSPELKLILRPKPEVNPVLKLKPKSEPEPELKLKLNPVLKFNPVPKLKTNLEPKPELNSELKLKLNPVPKWKPNPEPKFKLNLEPKIKPNPDPKWKPNPDPKIKPNPEPKWKPKPEPKPEPKPNPEEEQAKEEEEDAGPHSDLLCPLCNDLYDEDKREPVLLPRCGHTFCRPCLSKDSKKGHFPCPTCRKRHIKPVVSDLPVQADLLARVEAYRDSKLGQCQIHNLALSYWCRQCQSSLCGNCSVKKGHDVIRMKELLDEKKEELRVQGDAILSNVVEEKQKIMIKVKECSLQLLRTCESSYLPDDSAQDVKEMLSDTKSSADFHFLTGSLKRMKSILGSLSRSPSDSEISSSSSSQGSKTPRLRRKRERKENQHKDQNTDLTHETKSTHRYSSPPQPNYVTNNPTNHRLQGTTSPNNNNNLLSRTSQPYGSLKKKSTTTEPAKDVKYAHYSQMYGSQGTSGSSKAVVASHGPLLGLLDQSLWPLRCCVYDDDGRRARLSWEEGRLHMFALGEDIDDAHFMIKLAVVQSIIPQDSPEVFLDLTAKGRPLGRVYIKLWGQLRRAQHYLALCMGTHGPSYRGAKFEEVYSRGLKGECLHGGPYLTPRGDLSAQGVMDNLEWDGKFKGPQQKGLLVGAGSGRPDRDSCFDICTIENTFRSFACPFGEVTGGWDTVLAAVAHRPVREVTMYDVGVVMPDLAPPTTQ
ncbi:uncharacterized protein LOC121862751 isoform X1 [Homarus americanus]|uniref:uncharacterized protein LOC121862751 isoform X1 n=1 Tax=Homarus americanus TaxID=6706 RepID=UPI001C46FC2D|nr:uncharacterized protein LOC121862751 isoform X1 [Homarus americanus]